MNDDEITFKPKDFADQNFAKEYPGMFRNYAVLRVKGRPSDLAVIEAFRMIQNGFNTDNVKLLGMACEVNPVVQAHISSILAAADIKKDLWSEKRAVHSLLEIVEDYRERGTTRLNAIKELNVLCKYVPLDEATNRKIGHTLEDFQKLDAEWKAGSEGSGSGEGGSGPVH